MGYELASDSGDRVYLTVLRGDCSRIRRVPVSHLVGNAFVSRMARRVVGCVVMPVSGYYVSSASGKCQATERLKDM